MRLFVLPFLLSRHYKDWRFAQPDIDDLTEVETTLNETMKHHPILDEAGALNASQLTARYGANQLIQKAIDAKTAIEDYVKEMTMNVALILKTYAARHGKDSTTGDRNQEPTKKKPRKSTHPYILIN